MRDKDPLSDLIRSIEESLQGGNWEPPTDDDPPAARPLTPVNPRRYVWAIAPLIIVIFLVRLLSLSTDWLWYSSLNLQSIFFTRITASIALFFVSALIFWVIWSINIFMMRRLTPNALDNTSFEHIVMLFGLRIYPLMLSIGAIIALFVGLALAAEWEIFLLYFNQIHFGLSDPLFGQDISFFLFTLPVWQIVHRWLLITLTLSLGANLIMSGIGWQGWVIRKSVSIHLSILAALILLLLAAQFRLSAYSLVYSQRGAVFGAGYTDVNAQLPAYNTLAIIGVVYAILLPLLVVFSQSEALTQNLSERIRRSIRSIWGPVGILAAIWGIVAILGGFIYPALVQRFQVSPNELNLEGPFIQHNIEFTRQAFDLASIDNVDYDASTPLTSDALLSQPATIANVRLWDYRPLRQTYNQIQALRQYYQFNDVDIDRYTIDGQVRQVMLAARELVPEQLNENAQTWVNRKLIYTHGYGVAVSPVAQVSPDGLPEFLVQNLPPQGVLPIHQPQIYFGELNKEYIIADTDQAEFDYPQGNETVTTVFEGTTGIRMNFLTRLLFALRFADINILLSDDIRSDSQLLWRRNIMERVSLVAPFLHYDSDPYIVIGEDGNLYWFLDAYTTSNRFPYSEPTRGRNLTRTPINYIRNPVKVVMSAYDGSMNFYLLEQNEPIAATYARIFPTLFTDVSEMSSDLLSHIRYPIGLFSIQAQVLRTYHMTDLVDFYNREDLWEWPTELFEGNPQPMEPYYVLMQLPDQEGLDFIQILPFTPANRENMIAWLAAHNDPERYGEKIVYQFGKDSLIYGPQQIEARIDQDPDISALLSLWNQPNQGSSVIRGNLLVIPVADSIIYVEPLYFQAEDGKIPELKRVILATANQVVMAENLAMALTQLFGSDILADQSLAQLLIDTGQSDGTSSLLTTNNSTQLELPAVDVTLDIATASLEELILLANEHYKLGQNHLRNGEWAEYGASMEALQSVLDRLIVTVGQSN